MPGGAEALARRPLGVVAGLTPAAALLGTATIPAGYAAVGRLVSDRAISLSPRQLADAGLAQTPGGVLVQARSAD